MCIITVIGLRVQRAGIFKGSIQKRLVFRVDMAQYLQGSSLEVLSKYHGVIILSCRNNEWPGVSKTPPCI